VQIADFRLKIEDWFFDSNDDDDDDDNNNNNNNNDNIHCDRYDNDGDDVAMMIMIEMTMIWITIAKMMINIIAVMR